MTKGKKIKAPDISGTEESLLNHSSVDTLQKSVISYEERLNYVNEISQPMAGRKLTKKIYKLIKKASKNRDCCKVGLKLVQSSIRKGATGLVILAGDVSPVDVIIHLPAVCEGKEIPYCYVPSKDDIGTAMGVTRGVISVLLIDNPEIHEIFTEVLDEVKTLPIPMIFKNMFDGQYIDVVAKEIKKHEKKARIPLESYRRFSKKKKTYKEAFSEVFNENIRSDGRKLNEHRKMYIKLGVSADCRGSCYIELGETKIIVGVHGPKEIPNIQEYTELGKLDCIIEYAPFASLTRKKSSLEQCDKFMSAAMRRALEPVFCRHEFPNLMIQVSAFVIEDDGSVLSAAITGACLAIAHGRLPLFDFAAAVSISLHNQLIFVDPTKAEEEFCLNTTSTDKKKVDNYGLINVAYMPHLDQMSHYQMSGKIDSDLYESTLEMILIQCRAIYSLCSKHLMEEVKLTTRHLSQVKETQDALDNLSVS